MLYEYPQSSDSRPAPRKFTVVPNSNRALVRLSTPKPRPSLLETNRTFSAGAKPSVGVARSTLAKAFLARFKSRGGQLKIKSALLPSFRAFWTASRGD